MAGGDFFGLKGWGSGGSGGRGRRLMEVDERGMMERWIDGNGVAFWLIMMMDV